jgi:hypothetical protein
MMRIPIQGFFSMLTIGTRLVQTRLCWVLAIAMCFALTGCDSNPSGPTAPSSYTSSTDKRDPPPPPAPAKTKAEKAGMKRGSNKAAQGAGPASSL